MSSVLSSNAGPGMAVYASTKAALDSITRVLARELGPRKIRANSPGLTETEGARGLGVVGSDFARQKIELSSATSRR